MLPVLMVAYQDFYPRSPCGERLLAPAPVAILFGISIHALLAESDESIPADYIALSGFLSTLSLRRATGGFGAD